MRFLQGTSPAYAKPRLAGREPDGNLEGRGNRYVGVIGLGMSLLQGEGLNKEEAFPLAFYFISNNVLNLDDHHPSHHGLHTRGHETGHSIHDHGRDHTPRRVAEVENTLTTSGQREAESQ